MKIETRFDNCSFDKPYLFDEVESAIELRIEMEELVSIQTRKNKRQGLQTLINEELGKFKWIISGPAYIEFHWYLNRLERRQTDKSADLDNLSKPILDSLCGESGILIDDSQLMSFASDWISKNQKLPGNHLTIQVRFINEYALYKSKLIFVQTSKAMYECFELGGGQLNSFFELKIYLYSKKKGLLNLNKTHLSDSHFDFHRTRLAKFNHRIYNYDRFNKLCQQNGLTFSKLLTLGRVFFRKKKEL